MATKTLYVLYNADASVMGKLRYTYRKICTSSEDNPACAACRLRPLFVAVATRAPDTDECRRYHPRRAVIERDASLA
jgi:hypothetical protein